MSNVHVIDTANSAIDDRVNCHCQINHGTR